MNDTRARDAIGIELLVRAGVPRLQAEVEMATDPGCQAVADLLLPTFERLAQRIAPLAELLAKAGA